MKKDNRLVKFTAFVLLITVAAIILVSSVILNISGGYIYEFYGGSLGRNSGNIYYYGDITLNMTGGTINGNAYTVGAAALTGTSTELSNIKVNMTGGTITGNLYGGGRRSSAYQSASKVALAQVKGKIDITISDNALMKGTVYGAGEGVSGFEEMGEVTGYG